MDAIKVSVTIELPGSQMMTPQECEENPQNYEKHKILLNVEHFDETTKRRYVKKEALVFRTRKCKPAKQAIQIGQEAYNYMVSSECPEWFRGFAAWRRLSKEARLIAHLDRTCKALGGTSFTYVIFDD